MTLAVNALGIPVEHVDQRIRLHGISWQGYEALLAMRGDQVGTRVAYWAGELELMSPSINHELLKKMLARLLEAYAEERGLELNGYGSWTIKLAEARCGVEPDECYTVGLRDSLPERPDIAIEIVWTAGGIDKLGIYQALGVPEVWFWQKGGLRFFLLEDAGYVPSTRSRLWPDLDPALITHCINEASQTQAVRILRTMLRHSKP